MAVDTPTDTGAAVPAGAAAAAGAEGFTMGLELAGGGAAATVAELDAGADTIFDIVDIFALTDDEGMATTAEALEAIFIAGAAANKGKLSRGHRQEQAHGSEVVAAAAAAMAAGGGGGAAIAVLAWGGVTMVELARGAGTMSTTTLEVAVTVDVSAGGDEETTLTAAAPVVHVPGTVTVCIIMEGTVIMTVDMTCEN